MSVDNAGQLKKAKPAAKYVLIDGMSHILKEAPADRQQNMATYSQSDLGLHPKLVRELTQFIKDV